MTDRAELAKRLLEIAGELHEGDSDILFLKEAATALSAEGGARGGYRAVPEVPTPEQIKAGCELSGQKVYCESEIRNIYRDMVDAAPPAPPTPAPQAPADMAYFAASERAAYKFPGTDQGELRDAYCQGAADAVSRTQAPGEEGLSQERIEILSRLVPLFWHAPFAGMEVSADGCVVPKDDLDKLLAAYRRPSPSPDLVAAKIEAVLETANEVIGDTEGPRTPAQARLTLALYEYDPVRFFLGLKEGCDCESKDDCDECLTNDEALARVRALAISSAGGE